MAFGLIEGKERKRPPPTTTSVTAISTFKSKIETCSDEIFNETIMLSPLTKRLRGGGCDGEDPSWNDDIEDGDYDHAMDIPDEDDEGMKKEKKVQLERIGKDSLLPESWIRKWGRPSVPSLLSSSSLSSSSSPQINLQWLDIDTVSTHPLRRHTNSSKIIIRNGKDVSLPGVLDNNQVPEIRIFGTTNEGQGITVHVHGYTPYAYFALPKGYELDMKYSNNDGDDNDEDGGVCAKIRCILDKILGQTKNKGGGGGGSSGGKEEFVVGVEYVPDKASIMGYVPSHDRFLKVYLSMPILVPALKRIMEGGLTLPGVRKIRPKNGSNKNVDDDGGDMIYEDGASRGMVFQPFECNIPFVLRYMIDQKITGAGWITLPAGSYSLRRGEDDEGGGRVKVDQKNTRRKVTRCQLEVDVCYEEIIANSVNDEVAKDEDVKVKNETDKVKHENDKVKIEDVKVKKEDIKVKHEDIKVKNEDVKVKNEDVKVKVEEKKKKKKTDWNSIAPLRVLSFDIECQGRKGYFPEAERDPVIQIGNSVSVYGEDIPIIKNVFTLGGCLPIVGCQVITSKTEGEMLLKWAEFLRAVDPDVITGYNVQNFDIPYLLDRAEVLFKKNGGRKGGRGKSGPSAIDFGVTDPLSSFKSWGRVIGSLAKMKESTFESSAFGRRQNIETAVEGRVVFDMLPYMRRNHKLSSYTLNAVCTEFIGSAKEDVHHSIISDLQDGSDEDRRRLASYCLKDAMLPQMLMDKLCVMVNYVEMARVTGVPVSFLISRGQQIKVFSMILRKCRDVGLLVPTLSPRGAASGGDNKFEGATVLDPIKAYYRDPIATLDFASLYPSIMQAYNLCYSTMVGGTAANSNGEECPGPDECEKSANGHTFVKSKVKKGILPTILGELLAARKRAKKDMKNAPTEFERAVQNGRQLALKISANSVYGFTGASVGQLPCLPIASSVTSYGRTLLEKTKEFVEGKYNTSNGYEHDATVVYGDTDSVMVRFGIGMTVKETFPLAVEVAEKCSQIFPHPILLEFEKVYFPYLLMAKKRYAGLMWTNTEKFDYMDTKGLETVRRDNCALVREVIQTSLDKILIHQNVPGAIDYVKSQIADLLQNKMDISRLVITKSLNKGAEYALGLGGKKEDYKMKQAHVELAARMKKRDPGSAPQMGDRVPYVIVAGTKGEANFEKSEDPIYVLENNLPIDCKWYLTNQLSKPLTRIFEPIIKDVEKDLLKGDHTRKIFIPTPTARKGSLMMFAKKKASCVGCKAGIDPSLGNLCTHCEKSKADIYIRKLAILREAETRYSNLWSEAQRIHGTILTDIMCTGDGCTCHFYRRKKVQADVRLAQEVVDKFGYY